MLEGKIMPETFLQNTMFPLDPGYSQWLGYLLKVISKAQLQLLKLNYQVHKIIYIDNGVTLLTG